ncbi:MAG: aldehyde reductase [Rhodobiaceae bacterium]|nr:aldehyde reductase [Rhodobiaceae bacterium]
MSIADTTVLVTGASGYIAQQVILALLAKGYKVRGTVRSLDKGPALKELLATEDPRANEIELFAADLTSDAGWDEATAGCTYVHHVASPIPAELPKDPNDLIDPARDGALRALRAAKKAGVKRVVLTSSVAAVGYGYKRLPLLLTEENWSDPDYLKDNTAYTRSKAIAEKAAWEYVNGEGAGLELATVNPSAVLGPVLSGDFSASLEILTLLMNGSLPATPKLGYQIVDVRDVAATHVAAMETPEAAGERFVAGSDFQWFQDIATTLREEYPDYAKKVPRRSLPSFLIPLLAIFNPVLKQILPELDKKRVASNEKAQRMLGITFRPAVESIKAGAESLIAHKVV